jgi:hypothetical protein
MTMPLVLYRFDLTKLIAICELFGPTVFALLIR